MEKKITKLRRIRREAGFGNCQPLAQAMGCSNMAVHYWETGVCKPRPAFAKRLEAILHTPTSTLLEYEGENEKGADANADPSKSQVKKQLTGSSCVKE
jgi:transcriptional regulator with XRE-family HTH domain